MGDYLIAVHPLRRPRNRDLRPNRSTKRFIQSPKSRRGDVVAQLADDKDRIKEAQNAGVLPPDAYIEAYLRSHAVFLKKVLVKNGVSLDTHF